MRRKKRSIQLLITSLASLAGFLYLLFFTKPTDEFSAGIVSTQILLFFLLFLCIFLTAATTYLTFDFRKGIFLGGMVVGYLILRFLHLTQPFFIIVLVALLVSLYFVSSSSKN